MTIPIIVQPSANGDTAATPIRTAVIQPLLVKQPTTATTATPSAPNVPAPPTDASTPAAPAPEEAASAPWYRSRTVQIAAGATIVGALAFWLWRR
jgi:hypothetical protein